MLLCCMAVAAVNTTHYFLSISLSILHCALSPLQCTALTSQATRPCTGSAWWLRSAHSHQVQRLILPLSVGLLTGPLLTVHTAT